MATRRSSRREKTSKKDASEDDCVVVEMSGPSTRSTKTQFKVEKVDSNEPSPGPSSPRKRMKKKEDLEDDAYASAMLLDVLAQVASDRLETEPKRVSAERKPSKRVLSTMELLSFEHLQQLNDKMLVNLFAELSANEMSRNYEFKCQLIPDECSTVFTSYGNELRGRSSMLAHLKQHLKQIKKQMEADPNFNFVAEPVHARKKRNAVHMRKVWSKSTKKMVVIQRPADSFTTLKKKKKGSRNSKKFRVDDMQEEEDDDDEEEEVEEEETEEKEMPEEEEEEQEEGPIEQQVEVDGAVPMQEIEVTTSEEYAHYEAPGESMEEKEQYILDLLCRTQPYQDHCYTTVFGKRFVKTEADGGDQTDTDESLNSHGGRVGHAVADSAHQAQAGTAGLPGAPPDNMPIVHEVVVQDVDPMDDSRPGKKSRYPPMPKASLAHQGRVQVLAELMSSSDEEDRQMTLQANGFKATPVRERRDPFSPDGSTDWERRMALRCIRDLRLRKTQDCMLKCKICENKTFTATATLMYHYRSHAGIKPFLCMICNTTFTRQHSLNYHMLIHNNQSRFTCKDCGRKFRHPSHFKEHMRRHTGETPFHCADCPLRFKTRNTYKRHLRTRHNKLLTADGIHLIQCPPVPTFKREPVPVKHEVVTPEVAVVMEMTDSDQSDVEQENQENQSSGLKAVAMNLHHEQIVLPPSHTASNRLLQFCSQVVSQEVPG